MPGGKDTGCACLTVWGDEIGKIKKRKLLPPYWYGSPRIPLAASTSIDQTSMTRIYIVEKIPVVMVLGHRGVVLVMPELLHIDRYPGCLKCNTKLTLCEDDAELGSAT